MKKFERLLKGHKSLVFLDFEGTQFSHEMIAIGAMHVSIDRNGYIKKHKKPFRIYVKAHNRVGKIVTDLTGITDFKVWVEIPTDLTYRVNSCKYEPISVVDNGDGTSMVTWEFNDWNLNNPLPDIDFQLEKLQETPAQKTNKIY